jgi:hypothetical protein
MADDLDAFFDDVDAAAEEAVDEEVVAPPPSKKAKIAPPVRPVGVIVAAASETKKIPPPPPPPIVEAPPPPPPATTQHGNNSYHTQTAGPALPPMGPLPSATATTTTTKKKSHVRTAAGQTWVDPSLDEWPENDFRIFVGNLGPEVTDEQLDAHFAVKFTSLLKSKIIRDVHKEGAPSRGYAFLSFGDALQCAACLRSMDQTWLGSRPIRLKRSSWKDRELKTVRQEGKKRKQQQKRRGLL